MKNLSLKELQKRELQMIKGGTNVSDSESSSSNNSSRCGWCWCAMFSGTHTTKKQATTCRSSSF